MTVPSQEFRPAADFPPTTRDRWRDAALAVLRRSGVEAESPEEALSTTTYDGVTISPLYDEADAPAGQGVPGLPPYVRGARPLPGWDVRQRHAVADPAAVLADLENGVTSLWLAVGPDAIPVDDLPRVLAPVYLDLAPVVLDAGADTARAAETLLRVAADRAGAADASPPVAGNLGADPLGLAARTGGPADFTVAAGLARRCATGHPGLRAITVDGTPYHDAGGSDAEELGCSVAAGVSCLRALTAEGLSVAEALGQLDFRYAATADQFLTIAKLRAARRLWARVAQVCGASESGAQRQHAVTSSAMMTARDPWVNMLRTTVACFAAGVGGADAVTVQPFDARLGLPDDFARRIARNTQSLLLEEAHAGRVADPAGGSWYVERLTADLAEAAWAWFREIERAGGMAAALESGLVAGRLAATRARRADDVAHRRTPITGVSEFPDIDEKIPARRPGPGLAAAGAGRGLPVVRYAAEFEALRDLADAQPRRPQVFLATIGPVAAHTARASFAANLFGAGGIATVTAGPGTDPAEIAAAFTASGAAVACLCSSDRLYGEHAAAVAAALRDAGALRIWLAGKGHYEGVDANLHAGGDALDVLRTTFDDLGVNR
ncbi:methylmalonyl-CoA mutase [Microtetraspora sp. NBRC 13810]|uniref:methylmalonyl-CoA mutase family protein n=1 Tax=Microtetraspora sp. NBRC 13810 TaxID=3030990 RepID=UPI0024A212B3|nr:methylmalonyl-CoA mutase family protein [Microtetraspora sp. NBRC 13810]GLW06702.1 methylmalonyl-CoA mutase [Microtetraspora sp. NBRC 13810]